MFSSYKVFVSYLLETSLLQTTFAAILFLFVVKTKLYINRDTSTDERVSKTILLCLHLRMRKTISD